MKTKTSTGACSACQTIFNYDTTTDVFSGETYCPVCVTRVKHSNRFGSPKIARKKYSGYRVLK